MRSRSLARLSDSTCILEAKPGKLGTKNTHQVFSNWSKGSQLYLFQVHYYIFHLKVNRAHKRKFDGNGKEIEPNFSETKKVNTGYLNSSYSEYI